jgi:glycosyltransferase involved in cell wall biosynthesis
MIALAIVVPCYNEEEVLPDTVARLVAILDALQSQGKISPTSQLCFVDDGSQDRTWALIEEFAGNDARVHGIRLSRNRGHQNALLAGLLTVDGDAVVSIDADLQDDVEVIEEMVDAHLQGKDIVLGVRDHRKTDALSKRFLAEGYYMLLRWMGVDIVFNHADFRLMSRRALIALSQYGEVNLFLRGVVPTLGFPTATVTYERHERLAGNSKYSLRKMLSLALHGVTSFSSVPLRIISVLGFVIFLITSGLSVWVIWVRFVAGNAVPGWASSVLPIYFLGGVQLLCIGVVGEYIAKIYMETKRRPRYIIDKRV